MRSGVAGFRNVLRGIGMLGGPVEILAGAIVTVLNSRVLNGLIFSKTYGFVGSEQGLLSRGLICENEYGPVKVRLPLQLALAAGLTRKDIGSLFLETFDCWRKTTTSPELGS